MDLYILPDKTRKKRRNQLARISLPRPGRSISIEASSLPNLFKKSLRSMAHELKKGVCSASSHSDCIMKIQIRAMDSKALLKTFLSQVLTLTYANHTIFCNMYIEELSEKKLIAQLYGNWFDTFDNKLKSIADRGLFIEKKEDNTWKGSISFEL